jgi:hypothetical protein
VCHPPQQKKQKTSPSSLIFSKNRSQFSPSVLSWIQKCQTCHYPPFSKETSASLEKALHRLKVTHTISTPLSNSSKTKLDSLSTFQVHQSPHSSFHP